MVTGLLVISVDGQLVGSFRDIVGLKTRKERGDQWRKLAVLDLDLPFTTTR